MSITNAKANGQTTAPGQAQPTTLANEAYLRLREDIINGCFAGGEPLRLEALKSRYGYSFSPLREALNRLRSERLVELSALKGFRMAALSIEEMWDAIETRIHIESQAFRLSIRHGGLDWEAAVVAAFHSLSRLAEGALGASLAGETPLRDLERHHHDFHFALISASGSRWLFEFAEQLYSQTERYRRPMLDRVDPVLGQRDLVAEHKELMDAALMRNEEKAADLLASHYRRTGKLLENQFDRDLAEVRKSIRAQAQPQGKVRASRPPQNQANLDA